MTDCNYKRDFPLLAGSDLAYLDNAATAQRPAAVLDALRDFYARSNANPLRGLYALAMDATDRCEDARQTVARFLNAPDPAQIVFTRNTTESINLVAYSWALDHLRPGDEILVTIAEHHSNLLPWQMAAARTGAVLRYLDCEPDGSFSDEAVRAAVTERTRLAAVHHISNVTGRIGPADRLIPLVHAAGGLVLVDAAQSAPHIPVDVQALDADFAAFSGHKLMGPMGIGVLYARRELLEEMTPFLRGGEMIDSVTRTGAVWAEVPHKFEAGTVNAGGAVGLAAAIGYLQSVGWQTIEERELALTRLALDGMNAIPGVRVLGSPRAEEHNGILSCTVQGVHPHDIAALLDEDGVAIRAGHHCAQPLLAHLGVRSTARASLAFYNDEQDVQKLLDSLKTLRRRMGYEC